jgi:hypothetical protein
MLCTDVCISPIVQLLNRRSASKKENVRASLLVVEKKIVNGKQCIGEDSRDPECSISTLVAFSVAVFKTVPSGTGVGVHCALSGQARC